VRPVTELQKHLGLVHELASPLLGEHLDFIDVAVGGDVAGGLVGGAGTITVEEMTSETQG